MIVFRARFFLILGKGFFGRYVVLFLFFGGIFLEFVGKLVGG